METPDESMIFLNLKDIFISMLNFISLKVEVLGLLFSSMER